MCIRDSGRVVGVEVLFTVTVHPVVLSGSIGKADRGAEIVIVFVDALYVNNKIEFNRGCVRVNGDTVDIFPASETFDGAAYRIEFWDDEVDRISSFDPRCWLRA